VPIHPRPSRFTYLLLLIGVFGAFLTSALAAASDLPPLRSEQPPYFSADLGIALDSLGRAAVSATVTLPYTELQWVRLDRGYGSAAEFTLVFQPRRGPRLYGDVWQRRLAVPGFPATRSPNTSIVEKRSFAVPPGDYEVRVSVRDLQGEMQATARQPIKIPDYSKVRVGFADLELGVVDSVSGAFAGVATRRYGLNVGQFAARVVLFDRRPGDWPRRYPFRWRLRDGDGVELATGVHEAVVAHSAEPVVVRPSRSDLFLGNYVFEVELEDGRSRWRADRSFEVEESGPPRGREFDRMLEPLSYVATAEEIDALKAVPVERQDEAWEEFWKKRDPTPETVRNEAMLEFFRRVRYADTHFQGFGAGWRSDMGRVYIRYGPPDHVETRPASASNVQTEIWYYNQPYRRFVFADREGFGRYVLVSPLGD
jgi:GWxTD domain-containing protein